MKTVSEVSRLSGVSVRTLHHYDAIGLLRPSAFSEGGYRLYDEAALSRLQQILLFRELEFPLCEIKEILESPRFDRGKALEQQIELLTLKKERLEGLISLAREIKTHETGGNQLNFSAFDTKKIDEYTARAKAIYGETPEYGEFEKKTAGLGEKENADLQKRMMGIFAEFGALKELSPESEKAGSLVKRLQEFITEHFYTCSDQVLNSLGTLYVSDGEFTTNIDEAGGKGTAQFVSRAISCYCKKKGL